MYSIIDIESTGSKEHKEAITEIAIFQFDGKEITDQFISLINPEQPIDNYVQRLTGITNNMVKRAPKFYEVAKRIIEITKNTILVGHNVNFDYKILKNSFSNLGYNFEIQTIDTLPLCHRLIPNQDSYSLGKLAKSLNIPLIDRHRASGDARATVEIFKILLEKDTEKNIIKKFINNKEEKEIININNFDSLIKDIPHKKGVYYFYDKNNNIIYIGKSKNIFTKIQKILYNNKNENIIIRQNITKINYELTATNLITLIKYNNELQIHKPIFNSRVITKKYNFSINTKNYINFEIKKIKEDNIQDIDCIVKYRNNLEAINSLKFIEKQLEKPNKTSGFSIILPDNFIFIDSGRNKTEKSFVLIKEQKIIGYGFFQIHKQIQNFESLYTLMIPIKENLNDIDELKRMYYLGKFKMIIKN